MTDHKGLPVAGYKPTQKAEDVAEVNVNKILEERALRQIDELMKNDSYDKRCIAEARTCIQTGFMWLNRGIFQPERISLPEDVMK